MTAQIHGRLGFTDRSDPLTHHWYGVIGPFEARPENAAGGSIAVVAHVLFTYGRERTGRRTFTLKPCR